MNIYEGLCQRRSIRRFQDREVPLEMMKRCVNAARLSPSAANLQPLKFITIRKNLKEIFQHTNWAGYLDWEPNEDKMPRGYIAIVKKDGEGWDLDVGIAAHSICLTAFEDGLGTCMLGAIDKEALSDILPIPEGYSLELMVGMGYPAEKAEVTEMDDSVKYYREGEVLKVPKRALEEVWIQY